MVQAIEEARGAEIAAALTGRIRSGEELLVRKGNAGIEVFHAGEPPVRNARPELYGQLLKASEQIASAGTSVMWVVGLASLLACAAIHLDWIDHVGPLAVAKLKSVWTYVVVLVAGFIVGMYWMEFLSARVYQTWKKTLVEGLGEARMSHLDLLSQIEGHTELKAVADMIKRDPRFELVD